MQTCWLKKSLGASIDVCEYDGYFDVVAKGILCVMKHGKTTEEVWVAAK